MLNEALRLVRIYHNKNKTEMASLLSISKSYITEIEKGNKKVTINVLKKYSDTLKIPMSSLLFFSEELEGIDHPWRAQVAIAGTVLDFLKLLAGDKILDEQENDRTLSS